MAYTVTKYKSVFGDHRIVGMDITADAATQAVFTGLQNIHFMHWSPVSMATIVGIKICANSNASGVQSFGVVGISGVTSGDRFYVTVYGT